MKCAEQVRNVYVRIQMWNTIYSYIISTYERETSHELTRYFVIREDSPTHS